MTCGHSGAELRGRLLDVRRKQVNMHRLYPRYLDEGGRNWYQRKGKNRWKEVAPAPMMRKLRERGAWRWTTEPERVLDGGRRAI